MTVKSWRLLLPLLVSWFVVTPVATAQIFDNHVHLWRGETSLREYEAQVKAAGIEQPLFGGMWFGGPNQALVGHPDEIRMSNDANMVLAKKHPEMLPIATVHPYDGQAALDEVSRVAKTGYRVLKIHPHTQKFDPGDPRVLAVAKRAGEVGLVVLIDNAGIVPGDHQDLFNLALAAPKTRFIFAHLGGMGFRFWNILKAAKTAEGLFADNIWFDISATVVLVDGSPIQSEFLWTMRNVGIDHLLLGSDYPQYNLAQTLAAVGRLNLTPEEERQIIYDNARSLFGLPTAPEH